MIGKEIDSRILSAFFSDETERFRTPAEPERGDSITIRLRTPKDAVRRAMVYMYGQEMAIMMRKVRSTGYFDLYEAEIVCISKELRYCFLAELDDGQVVYNKTGARQTEDDNVPDSKFAFRFTPGFHVPEWAKGAVQYQIFTDRFRNGNPDNDVCDNEYYYVVGHSRHAEWDDMPNDTDIRTFYGGDLQGVMEKLDYLQELGVEAIYFNPLFVSPSSHKYDTQDYDYIDPHFAIITDDIDHAMQSWEKHNGYAPRYIRRVTSIENLEKSNAFFAKLCQELHRRGMKIILDGVFNHCGSFNKWMDREGVYLGKPGYDEGAYQSVGSRYRDFFRFSAKGSARYSDYEGWWGHATMPKLNYEDSPRLRETILETAEKWAKPPYSIDGWRLDVAADLGHSEEFNHEFWREFRTRLKAINPDLLIIAEHYGDPGEWLHGDQWDTVMNYDAFMDPLSTFLTGMEKHSDERRDDLYLDGQEFFSVIQRKMAAFQGPSLQCAMNELSNHDHSRFLTRTNRRVGRLENAGSEAAGEGINKDIFREAVLIQMTWPGAPTIYYADEAGQVGWTDPDNRRTYPWGREDRGLIELHKKLTALRKEYPVLRTGSFKPVHAENGVIAYARFDDDSAALITVNASDKDRSIDIHVRDMGIADGRKLIRRIATGKGGFSTEGIITGSAENGIISIQLPAETSAVYTAV